MISYNIIWYHIISYNYIIYIYTCIYIYILYVYTHIDILIYSIIYIIYIIYYIYIIYIIYYILYIYWYIPDVFWILPFLGKVVTYVGTVTGGRLDRMGRYEILVGARTPGWSYRGKRPQTVWGQWGVGNQCFSFKYKQFVAILCVGPHTRTSTLI